MPKLYSARIDEIGWFSLHNLPKPIHTGFQYSLNKFGEYFEKYNKF